LKQTKVLVLIPTYNEALNIERLTDRVLELDVKNLGAKIDIFVMDDESPDGTLDIVKKMAKGKHKGRIFYRTGKKQGLGVAMFKAFDYFLSDFDHDIIVTMDADFSHNPEDIPGLLRAAIEENADVAVGSRYVDGGLIPGTWPIGLIIRTRVAAYVARWLGGIDDSLQELTTNFRAIKRDVIANMPYNDFEAKGYGFHLYMVNHFTQNDLKLIEVPIAFHSRNEGASKSRLKDVTEFFKIAFNLNPDSPAKQVLRFTLIGASGVFVNLAALYILSENVVFNAGYLSLAAIQISILWNFLWHTLYTFKRTRMHDRAFLSIQTVREYIKYQLAASLTQLLTLSVFLTLNSAGIYFLIAQVTGIGVAFLVNYYISKTYIWSVKKAARA